MSPKQPKPDQNMLDSMAKMAVDKFGRPMTQPEYLTCTLCGKELLRMPVHARNTTKDGLFEQQYNIHYRCAKHSGSPSFYEFEREFEQLQAVHNKKQAQQEGIPVHKEGSHAQKLQTAKERKLLIAQVMEEKGLSEKEAIELVDGGKVDKPSTPKQDQEPPAPAQNSLPPTEESEEAEVPLEYEEEE